MTEDAGADAPHDPGVVLMRPARWQLWFWLALLALAIAVTIADVSAGDGVSAITFLRFAAPVTFLTLSTRTITRIDADGVSYHAPLAHRTLRWDSADALVLPDGGNRFTIRTVLRSGPKSVAVDPPWQRIDGPDPVATAMGYAELHGVEIRGVDPTPRDGRFVLLIGVIVLLVLVPLTIVSILVGQSMR